MNELVEYNIKRKRKGSIGVSGNGQIGDLTFPVKYEIEPEANLGKGRVN